MTEVKNGIFTAKTKQNGLRYKVNLPSLSDEMDFTDLFNSDPNNYGLIINALMTIGMFYYKQQKYSKVKRYLERALHYFNSDKESDRRYVAIINTLEEIKEN